MITIKRRCSIKIITRALLNDGMPLVALLMPDAEDFELCLDQAQLQSRIDVHPQAIIVYNQQADAISLVQKLRLLPAQIFIEIKQDTRGVLGLHATRRQGDSAQTVELVYQ